MTQVIDHAESVMLMTFSTHVTVGSFPPGIIKIPSVPPSPPKKVFFFYNLKQLKGVFINFGTQYPKLTASKHTINFSLRLSYIATPSENTLGPQLHCHTTPSENTLWPQLLCHTT